MEEPTPESNGLAMSRLRIRETIISPNRIGFRMSVLKYHSRNKQIKSNARRCQPLRWPSSFTQRTYVLATRQRIYVYVVLVLAQQSRANPHQVWQKKRNCCTQQYCCNSPRVLGTRWVHTLGHLEIDKPPSLRCGEGRLELPVAFLLLCSTSSDLSTTAWLNPMSSGSKIDQPQKECPSGVQPPSDFRDTRHRLHGRRFSLTQEQQRCARSNLCAVPRRLRAMTQGVCKKQKKGGVMRAVTRVCCCSIFCPKMYFRLLTWGIAVSSLGLRLKKRPIPAFFF